MRPHEHKVAQSFLVFVAVLVMGTTASAVEVGKPFPNFDARDPISGKNFSLADFRGKVVLVDFWATWCGPCVRELPNVKRAHENYGDKGLAIISISLDNDRSKFKSFVKERGMDWHHVMDGGGWDTRLAKKYGIRSIPAMFLVDDQGICVAAGLHGERLNTEIARALKNVKPAAAGGDSRDSHAGERPVAAPADLRGAIEPAAASAMQSQLDEVRGELTTAGAPLQLMAQEIESLRQLARSIESDLPVPAKPHTTRDAYIRLRRNLKDARRELFMVGLLNDRAIELPADLFSVAGAAADQRAFLRARSELSVANVAIEALSAALGPPRDHIVVMMQSIGSLRREISEGRGDEAALQRRCDDLCAEVSALSDHWSQAWQSQVRSLEAVAESMNGHEAALTKRVDDAMQSLTGIQSRLSPPPPTDPALQVLKTDYTKLLDDLRLLNEQVQQADPAAVKPSKMPANPFERRGLRDRMLIPEVEVQARIAAEALKTLRESCLKLQASSQNESDTLRPRIVALQAQLEAASSADAQLKVKNEFASLCDELLK